MPNKQTSATEAPFQVSHTRNFTHWLDEQKTSIAFTTYQANKIFMMGLANGRLKIEERTFERSMGLASHNNSLYLGTAYQLWKLENFIGNTDTKEIYDKVYVPNQSWVTGDVDIHDIAITADGTPIFVNTLFSCLSKVSAHASFDVVWQPDFISRLAPEDRCHLNGLAMVDGKPKFVTAVSRSDVHDGWREHRRDGGIVIDTQSNETLCSGLSMPHSPRFHDGKLWLINSGEGEFGYVHPETGRFEALTFCPGYGRGLSIHNGYALVGLSRPRFDKTFSELALEEKLAKRNVSARSGILVIDLDSGDIVHSLTIDGLVRELYDVILLPGAITPTLIGLKDDTVRTTIRIGD